MLPSRFFLCFWLLATCVFYIWVWISLFLSYVGVILKIKPGELRLYPSFFPLLCSLLCFGSYQFISVAISGFSYRSLRFCFFFHLFFCSSDYALSFNLYSYSLTCFSAISHLLFNLSWNYFRFLLFTVKFLISICGISIAYRYYLLDETFSHFYISLKHCFFLFFEHRYSSCFELIVYKNPVSGPFLTVSINK